MSAKHLKKLSKYIPLWQRQIPEYPLYWKGNPQLRVLLPLFWMKMLKPKREMPKDQVVFEIHPQMSDYDVKNYLEKIYKVSALTVRTDVVQGEKRHHPEKGHQLVPEPDKRIAFIQLENETFTFPDIFHDKPTEEEKNFKELETLQKNSNKELKKNWNKSDIPPWFR